MRRIAAIIRKDIALRFSSRSEWLFFLILPIVFTVVLAGGTAAPTDSRIRLAVVDQAGSALSEELLAALEQSEAVRPERLSLSQAQSAFDRRQVSTLLVIPPEFTPERLAAQGVELELRRQPNNMNALIASQAVASVAKRISSAVDIATASMQQAEAIRPFDSVAARQAHFDAAFRASQEALRRAPERLSVAQAATQDAVEYDPRANSSAGQLITWVFVPLIGLSALFALERQRGTLRRLLTTPTHRATYLLGTISGQVLMALVQMLLLVIFGAKVMGLDWGHSPAALALMFVSSALAAAALGTALGTLVKTESQANGLSIMSGMVMALLGGCWYPIELFPPLVRTATRILPTRWAMQGLLDIVLRGQGAGAVAQEAAVLLGFAAVFFAVGVWRFRYE